jgi:small neutral amino acid transporter SnatA (MarC family)
MIFASPRGLRSRTVREQEETSYEHDVSVFPLAIPLLAGPGAITTVLLYTGGRDLSAIVVFVGRTGCGDAPDPHLPLARSRYHAALWGERL